MPFPPTAPKAIVHTDADQRAFEAGRRAGAAVLAILHQRPARVDTRTPGGKPAEAPAVKPALGR